MSTINTPVCIISDSNTGKEDCFFTPDKMVGAILIPKNKRWTDSEAADIITALQALVLAARSLRAYPIFRFEELADNSEEPTVNSLGYGSKQIGRDGKYHWQFRFIDGGLCFNNKLRSFNGTNMKAVFVDDNGVLYMTRTPDGKIGGMSLDFFHANPMKINDGSNAAMFNVQFALSKPKEFNENIVFVQTSVDVEEAVKGVIDVTLEEQAVVAGKITVGAKTKCAKTTLYDAYDDLLADGTLWNLTKAGVAVAITGVVKNATTGGWDVSFVESGDLVLSLKDPATLAAAGVGGAPDAGFESDELTSTVPAP